MPPLLKREDIYEKLAFAERRLRELLELNGGNLQGADASTRQQLIQEVFFHLVGATEVLAQLVNELRALGIDPEDVTIMRVSKALSLNDPVKPKLAALTARTQGEPLPPNPYSDNSYIFRIRNYRHQVTHRRRNPFFFRAGSAPATSLVLDPRDREQIASERSLEDEVRYMLNLVHNRCEEILALLYMTSDQRRQFMEFGCVSRCLIELAQNKGNAITEDEFCARFAYLFLTPGQYGNLIDSQIAQVTRKLDLGHDFHVIQLYDSVLWEAGHEGRDVLVLSEIDLRENETGPVKHCSLLRQIEPDRFRLWIPWNNAPATERDFEKNVWTMKACKAVVLIKAK
jgi:hypothetical protein